jgi:hypothetical protein
MNEIALEQVFSSGSLRERFLGTRETRLSSAFYGYALTLLAIEIGWLLRGWDYITPENGTGYWLGIVGGSMMLVLLLYPLRKRIKVLRFLGDTSHWFRIHMILGVLGPLLVLYHANFQLGSFNSKVAMYCMLLVAGSGVIGRELYARIHRGLYGCKTNLGELRSDLASSIEKSRGLATLLPNLIEKLDTASKMIQGDSLTGTLSVRESLVWVFRKYVVWVSLWMTARSELKARAAESEAIARDYRRLRRASTLYIGNFVRLTGRVAQFTLCERMFSAWHVLHLPLFFMMVISALIHVLAVHMY